MAAVTLQQVTKRFGTVSVIESVDLEIQDHEFMVLVGPSGCGKSTLLRMIAGLEEVTGGTISIGGRVVNDVQPKDRDVAMVFQNYALYPHMTIHQNLEFGLRIRSTPQPEIDRLIAEAAEILGISQLLERKPKELSGGQRQRVALGRAIVRKPSVFLFDEPLSNLDAKLRVQMRSEIKKLQQRLQTTTIYVTHDQIEAMTMGHRIAVLNGGKLEHVGTPLEVYEHPASVFVANFIGTPPMNFMRGTLRDSGGSVQTSVAQLALPAAWREIAARNVGREVVIGIRPEHLLDPARKGRGMETAEVEITVELVETLGDELVVHGSAGGESFVFKMDPHSAPKMGDRVKVALDLSALQLFDAGTQKRLQ
jgi:multiple sugar transport system ATP-binding protein